MQRSKLRADIKFINQWLGATTKEIKLKKLFEINSQRAEEKLADYKKMKKSPIAAHRKYAQRVLAEVHE